MVISESKKYGKENSKRASQETKNKRLAATFSFSNIDTIEKILSIRKAAMPIMYVTKSIFFNAPLFSVSSG